jgi:hypothetical protein
VTIETRPVTDVKQSNDASTIGAAEASRARSSLQRLHRWLSAGSSLPPDVWEQRHRWILRLLWVQVPVVYVFGLVQHVGLQHALVEASIIGIIATAATVATMTVGTDDWPRSSRPSA